MSRKRKSPNKLISAVEAGECAVITRNVRTVAQLTLPPVKRRKVQFDGMRDRIHLPPGWDDPIDPDEFLQGGL